MYNPFASAEMDLQYLMWAPKQIRVPYSQYLTFNDKDQTIEISPHLPDDHPLQNFIKIGENGKMVLDVDKYFNLVWFPKFTFYVLNFFSQFLSCTFEILKEMESEWPEALKEVKLEKFTVEHDPCIKCMTMEYDDPLAVRWLESPIIDCLFLFITLQMLPPQ